MAPSFHLLGFQEDPTSLLCPGAASNQPSPQSSDLQVPDSCDICMDIHTAPSHLSFGFGHASQLIHLPLNTYCMRGPSLWPGCLLPHCLTWHRPCPQCPQGQGRQPPNPSCTHNLGLLSRSIWCISSPSAKAICLNAGRHASLPKNFPEFSKATGQKPASSAWRMNFL